MRLHRDIFICSYVLKEWGEGDWEAHYDDEAPQLRGELSDGDGIWVYLYNQGVGGRTHLMSPAMAAVAAIVGKFADVRHRPRREGTRLSPGCRAGRSRGYRRQKSGGA